MSLNVKAYEKEKCYEFIVSDSTEKYTHTYQFTKERPDGVSVQDYLQNCKNESLSLAEIEINGKQTPEELNI